MWNYENWSELISVWYYQSAADTSLALFRATRSSQWMNGDALAILSPRLAFCQTFFVMAVIIILENDEKLTTSCVYVSNKRHTYIRKYKGFPVFWPAVFSMALYKTPYLRAPMCYSLITHLVNLRHAAWHIRSIIRLWSSFDLCRKVLLRVVSARTNLLRNRGSPLQLFPSFPFQVSLVWPWGV